MKYRVLIKVCIDEKEAKYETKQANIHFGSAFYEFSLESESYCVYYGYSYDTEEEARRAKNKMMEKYKKMDLFIQNKERW